MRRLILPALLALSGVQASAVETTVRSFVVAQDGSGDFTTVQAALDTVPDQGKEPTVIHIKPGTYREKITVSVTKWYVELDGDDAASTILTWADYSGQPNTDVYTEGVTTTASVWIEGKHFTARNLTFANSADARVPATAAAVIGGKARFFDCRFVGYQDTLEVMYREQYFKRCYIEGAVDIIFGNSTAVFDQCTIFCTDSGFVTAAATPETSEYGYVFRHCTVTGTAPEASVYLGRPWGEAGRTVFIHCDLGAIIAPDGWADWDDKGALGGNVFYAEYEDTGEGAQAASRVSWASQLTDEDAAAYRLRKIFDITAAPGMHVDVVQKPWYDESQ